MFIFIHCIFQKSAKKMIYGKRTTCYFGYILTKTLRIFCKPKILTWLLYIWDSRCYFGLESRFCLINAIIIGKKNASKIWMRLGTRNWSSKYESLQVRVSVCWSKVLHREEWKNGCFRLQRFDGKQNIEMLGNLDEERVWLDINKLKYSVQPSQQQNIVS